MDTEQNKKRKGETMKQYRVTVSDEITYRLIVEANSAQDAENKALSELDEEDYTSVQEKTTDRREVLGKALEVKP